VSAVIGPGGSREFPYISASGDFCRHRHDGDRAASLGFAASQWHEVDQPNKLLWGDARDHGKRAVAVQGSLLSRWVRIFSITIGSSRLSLPIARDGGSAGNCQEQSLPASLYLTATGSRFK